MDQTLNNIITETYVIVFIKTHNLYTHINTCARMHDN